MKIFEH